MDSARHRKSTPRCTILAALLVIQHGFLLSQATPSQPLSPSSTPAAVAREPADILRKGQELISAGMLEEAVALLRKLVAEHPDNPDAHLLLGTALALVPKRSESLAELQRAVELRPAFAPGYHSLGMALGRLGESALARKAFEKAVELDANFIDARINLALVLAELNEFSLAGEHLDRILAMLGDEPRAAYAHYLRGAIYIEKSDPQRAVWHFEKAVKLRPDYAEAYLKLGLARQRLADVHGSFAALSKAVQFDPNGFEAQYRLGLAYLQSGEAAKALGHLKRAERLQPQNQAVLYSLVRTLRRMGRLDEALSFEGKFMAARSTLEKISENSLRASELNNEAVELERGGRFQEAVVKYQEALELDPLHGGFRRNLGLVLCRLGKWDEGTEELKEVLRRNPDDQETRRALYIAMDKAEAAKNSHQKGAGNRGRTPKKSDP